MADIDRVMMKVSEIDGAKFNPLPRIKNDKYMKSLILSIKTQGFLPSFPLLYSGIDKCLGDGHRRLHACQELGITEAPVDVYNKKSAAQLWSEFSNTKKNMSPKDVTVAMASGLGMDNIPDAQKKNVLQAIDYIGEDGLDYLAENYISPSVVGRAIKIAKYCGRKDRVFVENCVYWMVKNKESFRVRKFMELGLDPDIISTAIKRGKPLDPKKLKLTD